MLLQAGPVPFYCFEPWNLIYPPPHDISRIISIPCLQAWPAVKPCLDQMKQHLFDFSLFYPLCELAGPNFRPFFQSAGKASCEAFTCTGKCSEKPFRFHSPSKKTTRITCCCQDKNKRLRRNLLQTGGDPEVCTGGAGVREKKAPSLVGEALSFPPQGCFPC
jgi:hypothetical protein